MIVLRFAVSMPSQVAAQQQQQKHRSPKRLLPCLPASNRKTHAPEPHTTQPTQHTARFTAMASSLSEKYKKWDKLELSDDEDDVHPNIDKQSWFRWKHQARVDR